MKRLLFWILGAALLPMAMSENVLGQSFPFEKEVQDIVLKYETKGWEEGAVLLTGSSTIRLWVSLEKDFPKARIINTGFGGSQAHELLHYLHELVTQYQPSKIFIYEGDNDIFSGKSPEEIMQTIEKLVSGIRAELPKTKVYLISAKPSPSRWHLQSQYEELNRQMRSFCDGRPYLSFVDTWQAMLDKSGNPNPYLFIEDQLHMNGKGYKVWKKILKPYVYSKN